MQIRIINVTRTAIKEMHKVEEMKTRNDMFISKHVLQHVPNKLRGQQVEIANHFINPGMNDSLIFFEAQARQHAIHSARAKDAHEVVL